MLDFLWRLFGDHRRSGWCLMFLLVVAGTTVGMAIVVAPHLGQFGTVLASLGAGGTGAAAVEGVRRRRRRPDDTDEER